MIFAWQGWMLDIPQSWNPQRLEGDFTSGYALIANLHGPTLGLRWTTPVSKGFDIQKWIGATLRQEVGQLAANESRLTGDSNWAHATIYEEPEPPGRDVWLAFSETSGRTIEMAYHLKNRDRVLQSQIVPQLRDTRADAEMLWSVFDLSCRSASGFRLSARSLNAGDLCLEFSRERERVLIRQMSVATLALKRLPIEDWLRQHAQRLRKQHVAVSDMQAISVNVDDGRMLTGVCQSFERRKTLFWRRDLPGKRFVAALHDESNDRLIVIEAANQETAEAWCVSVGWAEAAAVGS